MTKKQFRLVIHSIFIAVLSGDRAKACREIRFLAGTPKVLPHYPQAITKGIVWKVSKTCWGLAGWKGLMTGRAVVQPSDEEASVVLRQARSVSRCRLNANSCRH